MDLLKNINNEIINSGYHIKNMEFSILKVFYNFKNNVNKYLCFSDKSEQCN